MVDFLDDVNIDGTVTAKRVKLTDSAGDEKDVATKEYVDNKVDSSVGGLSIPHIHISTNAPTANDGQAGDIWYQYE